MKLKTIDVNGTVYAVLQDGKPVYTHDDGKETPFDAPGTRDTITRLNGEAKSHRERAEAAEEKLKGFTGIEDPAAAIKALGIVKNLDAKKLIDAGEVERVKAEAKTAFDEQLKSVEAKYKPVMKERDDLQAALVAEKVGGSFARSKFIAEKLAIPPDMVEARFASSFKVETGNVVAYDPSGNKLFSRARPGELAQFDEALEMLVDAYPYRDHIVKSSGASGGGARGNPGGAGGKTLPRAAFTALSPADQMAHVKAGGTVTD
jgi:hypothetical protein